MPTRIVESTKSFALARVDILVGRVFSAASLLSFIEVLVNALRFSTLQDSPLELGALLVLALTQVANLISFIAKSSTKIWYRGQALVTLAALVLWPLITHLESSTTNKPWVWWALGTAAIAATRGFRPWISCCSWWSSPRATR